MRSKILVSRWHDDYKFRLQEWMLTRIVYRVTAYYAKVSGAKYVTSQGGYTFPCSSTLPSLTLGIGAGKFTIPGTYINYAPATGSSESPSHQTIPRRH